MSSCSLVGALARPVRPACGPRLTGLSLVPVMWAPGCPWAVDVGVRVLPLLPQLLSTSPQSRLQDLGLWMGFGVAPGSPTPWAPRGPSCTAAQSRRGAWLLTGARSQLACNTHLCPTFSGVSVLFLMIPFLRPRPIRAPGATPYQGRRGLLSCVRSGSRPSKWTIAPGPGREQSQGRPLCWGEQREKVGGLGLQRPGSVVTVGRLPCGREHS